MEPFNVWDLHNSKTTRYGIAVEIDPNAPEASAQLFHNLILAHGGSSSSTHMGFQNGHIVGTGYARNDGVFLDVDMLDFLTRHN